jgi:hypothetical protein
MTKPRIAPMTADERATVESICQYWPMQIRSATYLARNGVRWADADELRAWRSANQSEGT